MLILSKVYTFGGSEMALIRYVVLSSFLIFFPTIHYTLYEVYGIPTNLPTLILY